MIKSQVRWGLHTAAAVIIGAAVWSRPGVTRADTPPHGKEIEDTQEKNEKEKDSEKKEKDTGIKVNGQTLWEDAKGNRYYYINGDKNSPFISVQQPDGSFKWSTMDTMLNKAAPANGLKQIGMIETSNGKLAVMYETAGGGRAFSNGSNWFETGKGQNSFSQVDKLTVKPAMEIKGPSPFRDLLQVRSPDRYDLKVPAVEMLPDKGITAPYSGSRSTGGADISGPGNPDMFGAPTSPGGRWNFIGCNSGQCRRVWVPN
jgi:hypothetical protein